MTQTYYAPWDPASRYPASVIYPRNALCREVKLPPTADQAALEAKLDGLSAERIEGITNQALLEWSQMIAWRPTGPNDGEPIIEAMRSGFYEYLILLGGRAGGKSHEAAEAIVQLCSESKQRVVCGREFMASIRDSSRSLLVAKIKQHPSAPQWTITDTELRHQNGTLITFLGLARNPESAKSLEGCTLFWGEEAQSISSASLEILIPTIREAGSMLLFTLNPRFADDPVYKLATDDVPEAAFVAYSAFENNPYLFTSRLMNDLRKSFLGSKRFKTIFRGDLDRNSDLVVIEHKVGTPPVLHPQMEKVFYGVDFGGTDPTAAVRVVFYPPESMGRDADARGALYISGEFMGITKSNRDIVEGVTGTFPELLEGRYILKADSADPKAIEELNLAGVPTNGAVKGAGSVLAGLRTIADHDVYVSPNCPQTIRAGENYRWKGDRAGNPTNVPEHEHSHLWDAVRYAIENEDLSSSTGVSYINLEPIGELL